MNDAKALQSILERNLTSFRKTVRTTPQNLTPKHFELIRSESGKLAEFLELFETYFPKKSVSDLEFSLTDIAESAGEVLAGESSLALLGKFSTNSKDSGDDRKNNSIDHAFVRSCEETLKSAQKKIKGVNPSAFRKKILDHFTPAPDFTFLTCKKMLNQRREMLFDQIVKLIRTSQDEDIEELRIQVTKFCFALDFAIQAGNGKIRRLRKVLGVLRNRLFNVYEEQYFKESIEALERARANDPVYVGDVQKLRLISRALGIRQANTHQAFHAQLPVALQVLKRPIQWA